MNKPIVPVYLNQKMVFDQIAMLKNGLSTITTVTHSESENTSNQSGISTGMGTSGIFGSLFKVNLAGTLANVDDKQSGVESSESRVHTPASLFYELRNLLNHGDLLSSLTTGMPKPGDFIEFECQLNRNPFLESLETAKEIGRLTKAFSNLPEPAPPRRNRKRNRGQEQNPTQQSPEEFSVDDTLKLIDFLLDMIVEGSTLDLVGMNINDSLSAVITLEAEFLNDPQMTDLVDGQFKVLGIVIKSIIDDTNSIDLVRNTTLSKMPPDFMAPISSGLTEFQKALRLDVPFLNIKIQGPAIQVLPVAIFA